MGSTGSGSFSDYSRRKSSNAENNDGGSSGVDKCSIAFATSLEDVARCFYFINHGDVPVIGLDIHITFNGIRLVAENKLGEELGYLPTEYNYLRFCLNEGFKYTGVINYSSSAPSPTIRVDIIPER